ncbi:MAG TPA: 50S ribosomal protein L15 [Candidatus Binataceae bacterium]|jgi:large subunit ribosomal protein L15
MDLKTLKPAPGSTHRRKRVGRGIGSGHGKTSGRGHKGLGSRSHGNTPPGYEGGQMPLQRRIPKHGFRRLQAAQTDRDRVSSVNLSRFSIFADGDTIDPGAMSAKGLVRKRHRVKILGTGEFKTRLTIRAHAFSKGAMAKIAAAGGSAEVIQ